MQSIVKMPALIALSMGALLGAQEAGAWCPTYPGGNTISCSNCTVTLTCNVSGKAPINITGSNVTFDGNWYSISYATSHAIYVNSGGNVYIQNVYLEDPTNLGVYAVSGSNSYLSLENVGIWSATLGVGHWYGGDLSVISGYVHSSGAGIFADGYGYGGYGNLQGTYISGNTGNGIELQSKPNSLLYSNTLTTNGGRGARINNSPGSAVNENGISSNTGYGLQLTSSNNTQIYSNNGYGNGTQDCITSSSSGVSAWSNSWGSYSGSCN